MTISEQMLDAYPADLGGIDKQRGDDHAPLSEDERAELVRLRRENAELAMQRDVTKRSVALWLSG